MIIDSQEIWKKKWNVKYDDNNNNNNNKISKKKENSLIIK